MLHLAIPAHAHSASSFIARTVHAIHWGDLPTWVAAVGGIVAAIYAIRAFNGVARQQALNDRILRYQAHSQARAIVAGIHTSVLPTDAEAPTRRVITLNNQSAFRIDDIRLFALLGGEPVATTQVMGVSAAMFGNDKPGDVLYPSSRETWQVNHPQATKVDELDYYFRFTDDAGGSWTLDDEGRLVPVDDDAPQNIRAMARKIYGRARR